MPKKITVDSTIQVKTYSVLSDCIERGINYGMSMAHKHTVTPSREHIEECIHDAIMADIDEYFKFPELEG